MKVLRILFSVSLAASLVLVAVVLLGHEREKTVALPEISPTADGDIFCVALDGGGPYPGCDQVFTDVQAAVDATTGGETVKVASGVYTAMQARPAPPGFAGSPAITQVLYISNTVTVRGGYTTADGFAEPPDPTATPSILDASHEAGRVILIAGNISVTLEGLEITGGNVNKMPPFLGNHTGSGVRVLTATVTLRNNRVYNNVARDGGGLYFENSPNARLEYNTIYGNGGNAIGGGIKNCGGAHFLHSPHTTLISNTIKGNHTANSGGGLCIGNSNHVELINNTIISNTRGDFWDGYGAGVYIVNSRNISLTDNLIQHNTGRDLNNLGTIMGGGVAIYHYSTVTLEANQIIENGATLGGGMLVWDNSAVSLISNVITGNISYDSMGVWSVNPGGGGLYIGDSTATLTNTVIADNVAETTGSGLHVQGGADVHLLHTTLARNTGGDGSGLHITGTNSTAALTNTILVSHTVGITVADGNMATLAATLWGTDTWRNLTDWDGAGTFVTGTYNLWGPPAFIDPDNGDYHIGDGSAAIDAGLPTDVVADIDGEPRPIDADLDCTPIADIGADEFVPAGAGVTLTLDALTFAGFDAVSVTGTRVLATGWVTVDLQAGGLQGCNAASLRLYTENAAGQRGMVGQSTPTETVPFKAWTPNFGLGYDADDDGVPDVDNDTNWKSATQTVWLYAIDQATPVTETLAPWDHALFNYTDLFKWSNAHPNPNYHLPPSGALTLQQPIHFALALESQAGPQVYSTTVTVDFAVSNDNGDSFTAFTANVPVSVTLTDAAPAMNLDVDATGFDNFGEVAPWSQRRLITTPLTVTASAYGLYPYDAATIRVYTKNDPDDAAQVHMGMMGNLDRDWTVPIKVWTPNFGAGIDGDGDGIPDIDNPTNWSDNQNAVWVYAFDWNQPIPETWWSELPPSHPYYDPQCAWCHPLFNYTDLFKWSNYYTATDAHGDLAYVLPQYLELTDRRPYSGADNRVPLYIAADFTDALPQTYSTTLYIEFTFSGDKGETVAQTAVETVTLSATVPGDGDSVNWLLNRVRMRPDMDATTPTVEKLADSYQEMLDGSDAGWTYDQALAVIALTAAGHVTEAREVLNGLDYLQNNDGSWFFSTMTSVTDDTISQWKDTDDVTLYSGTTCLTETVSGGNGHPDELEKRVCWDETHNLPVDQLGPWLLHDYTDTESPQTATLLPDLIKYRTYDFRKYLGTNAWVVMALNFYEAETGDTTYRGMAEAALSWIDAHYNVTDTSPAYGGLSMGRTWHRHLLTDTLDTTYGFVNLPVYVAEHNFDAYAAYRGFAQLTGETMWPHSWAQKATLIKNFLLRELWAPHVNLDHHPEVDPASIDNYFFPGIDIGDPISYPYGLIDTSCIYLDGLSWSNLALGSQTVVLDKDGITGTLALALDFADEHLVVTDATIHLGTGYEVTGIDGYKESTCSEDFVWSEGSEGIVAARYLAGRPEDIVLADDYHAETASYMMSNGGVPYSTLSDDNWTDANSIAGTAWYYFNEREPKLNPFARMYTVYLPLVIRTQ